MGHTSSAHSVTITSISGRGTSDSPLARWWDVSIPSSASAATASGWRVPGSDPALWNWNPAGAMARANPSAIWLRAEFATQRTNTFGMFNNTGRLRSSPTASDASAATVVRGRTTVRSEEHTSELQSRVDLVCRLLLEKKKKQNIKYNQQTHHKNTNK